MTQGITNQGMTVADEPPNAIPNSGVLRLAAPNTSDTVVILSKPKEHPVQHHNPMMVGYEPLPKVGD